MASSFSCKKWLKTVYFLVLMILISSIDDADADVPALYVFGDSTADVGNNNFLKTQSKADFPHYGVDFPLSRATGRFSNGYNGIDFLAKYMGFRRSPPPFLSVANKFHHHTIHTTKGLKGISFASGGSGILDSTGNTIPLRQQIRHFATIKSLLSTTMTREKTDIVLSKSIFLISTGGNDIFGYFSINNAPNRTEKEMFISTLISSYKDHVEELYSLGAKKIGIVDVPPIGCCPYPRSLNPTGGCIDVLNDLALKFNNAVKALMHHLGSTKTGMKYSIGSSHAVVSNIIRNPHALGFKEVKTACCGSGRFNAQSACMPNATYCSDRRSYLFWDMLHPTHAASKLAGLAIYNGSLEFATPINFKQLVDG